MKNVTFSAAEGLIEAARVRARRENTTLNAAFRAWLAGYARAANGAVFAAAVVDRLRGRVVVGGRLGRDEMNAR